LIPLLSVLSFVISVFSFFFFRSYLRRRTGAERIMAEFREEFDGMITELNEVTVRDETLVEERVKTLRALLEDTDRRIATYVRERERRDTEAVVFDDYSRGAGAGRGAEPAGYAALGNRLRSPFTSGVEETGKDAPAVYLSPELFGGNGPGAGNPAVETAQNNAEPAPPPQNKEPAYPRIQRAARQIPPKPKPFAEQAVELHRAGFSAGLIASKLGATVTEVELAIALAGQGSGSG
jgi:hypothetical protein